MSDEARSPSPKRFTFPRWSNYALPAIAVLVAGGALYMPVAVGLGFSPKTTAVGYAPEQPVPYSHALHAGQLGMDCRYCHTTVDKAAFAAIPPTQICVNCHRPENPETKDAGGIHAKSPRLKPIHESWRSGKPVEWIKIHDLPDYAYFNHSAHVTKGVSCVSCHGRIDQMDVVQQVAPLSMSWCLDCHRDPAPNIRPVDQVTNLGWKPDLNPGETEADARRRVGTDLMGKLKIHDSAYMTSCFTCHR